MCVDKKEQEGENKESLSSCRLSVFFQKSTRWETCTEVMVVPQTKKTKRHKCDGNSLVYTSHFLFPSVSLCHSVFSKILMLLAYFPKKKKKKMALKIASSLHSWHVRKRVMLPHWWFDWKNTAGSPTSRTGGLRERDREREKNGRGWKMSNMTDLF